MEARLNSGGLMQELRERERQAHEARSDISTFRFFTDGTKGLPKIFFQKKQKIERKKSPLRGKERVNESLVK